VSTPTRDELLVQVRKVMDPCSIKMCAPVDIWEMGLVEELEVVEGRARVTLVLTDISCVFYQQIRRHVTDVLLELPGVQAVEVQLATHILWTPDRMRRQTTEPAAISLRT
jgi:metal-sulfur cluster biosynthetic enzyme